MEIAIRRFEECDQSAREAVLSWHQSEWGTEWADYVKNLETGKGIPAVFVAFAGDGIPVGTSMIVEEDMLTRPDLGPWLGGVYVRPDFRKHGYGTALTSYAMKSAKACGIGALWLYTAKARHLYERLGWEYVSTEFYPVEDQDVAIMNWKAE